MALLNDLRTKADDLTERERDIRRYVLDHPEDIESLSARELGAATFTSAASVTRFCQKLGCKGYPEFKLRFLAELRDASMRRPAREHAVQMAPHESSATLAHKIAEVQYRSVELTQRELNLGTVMRASKLIAAAQHLDFYAYDSSACIAEYACNEFYFAGKRAQVYRDTNMQGLNASLPAAGHVAILISHTGRNTRLIALANQLRRGGTPAIALTRDADSPLARAVDENLVAVSLPEQIDAFWVQSFASSAKYLLDLLASLAFNQRYADNMERNSRYEQFGSTSLWALTEPPAAR